MGTVFQVPWTRCGDVEETIAELRGGGFAVIATGLTADSIEFTDYLREAPGKVAIFFGSEGHGASDETLAGVDVVVRIDMAGGVDSLNVASSSGIVLWGLREKWRMGRR